MDKFKKFTKSITVDLAEEMFALEIYYLAFFKSKYTSYEIHQMYLGLKFEFFFFLPVVAITFSLSHKTRLIASAARVC